ncbi:hypothetical protein SERLA73DRAFT_183784, partial [Serpula lacrymans var. lacrymans S7.3]
NLSLRVSIVDSVHESIGAKDIARLKIKFSLRQFDDSKVRKVHWAGYDLEVINKVSFRHSGSNVFGVGIGTELLL